MTGSEGRAERHLPPTLLGNWKLLFERRWSRCFEFVRDEVELSKYNILGVGFGLFYNSWGPVTGCVSKSGTLENGNQHEANPLKES